jgi:MULE transposase domain
MPLLNICAITGGNKVLQIALAFLSNETTESYNWALGQLAEVMKSQNIKQPLSIVTDRELALMNAVNTQFPQSPHILCRWHVNMNVLAKCKRFFPAPIKGSDNITRRHPQFKAFMRDWVSILNSSTKSEYLLNLAKLRTYPRGAVEYVEGTWLTLWKEKLVRYWINQALHFDVLVTSPIEGCHGTLKQYLQRGSGDLNTVFDKLVVFWDAQQQGITESLAREKLRPKHNINTPLFAALIGYVYAYALQKLVIEQTKIPKDGIALPFQCNCIIPFTTGLPCFHTIYERKRNGGVIRLDDIHPHWHYNPTNIAQVQDRQVLEPLAIRGKGRPKGSLGTGASANGIHTTKRLPSAFELPSSSAPAALDIRPARQEKLFIAQTGLSTTSLGMSRIEGGHVDMYEPGTIRERAYMRGIASIYQTDSIVDSAKLANNLVQNETQDCIEVEVPSQDS